MYMYVIPLLATNKTYNEKNKERETERRNY